eukprot:m.128480 g.128480  ORF g.128480 m.128480 type:complete len:84 (-) comp15671_c0_seq1:1661-1912(-)
MNGIRDALAAEEVELTLDPFLPEADASTDRYTHDKWTLAYSIASLDAISLLCITHAPLTRISRKRFIIEITKTLMLNDELRGL